MFLYALSETIKLLIQILFGNELFSLPVLSTIRNIIYRITFSMGSAPTIGARARLTRSHKKAAGKIHIGSKVLLAKHCEIDYSGRVDIEDNVWISEGVNIFTHHHDTTPKRFEQKNSDIVTSEIVLKKGCWIGAGSIVLPNVKYIGCNSVVGAGSVVTKDVPDNVIVAGNPAVFIRNIEK